jgi:hypothetical protein
MMSSKQLPNKAKSLAQIELSCVFVVLPSTLSYVIAVKKRDLLHVPAVFKKSGPLNHCQ